MDIISAVHKTGHLRSELGNQQILFSSWLWWRAIPFAHTWWIVFFLSFVSDDLPNEEDFRDFREKVIFITILHFKRCKVTESKLWKCPVKIIYSSWICMGVSPASVSRRTMHTHCLQKSEEGVRSPGSGVTHGCELPLGALEEYHQMSPFLCNWYHHNYHDLDRAFHAYVLFF